MNEPTVLSRIVVAIVIVVVFVVHWRTIGPYPGSLFDDILHVNPSVFTNNVWRKYGWNGITFWLWVNRGKITTIVLAYISGIIPVHFCRKILKIDITLHHRIVVIVYRSPAPFWWWSHRTVRELPVEPAFLSDKCLCVVTNTFTILGIMPFVNFALVVQQPLLPLERCYRIFISVRS